MPFSEVLQYNSESQNESPQHLAYLLGQSELVNEYVDKFVSGKENALILLCGNLKLKRDMSSKVAKGSMVVFLQAGITNKYLSNLMLYGLKRV